MKLENGIMRPATVLEVVDTKGTIKAEVPGLFSITDKPELLPPIYPLFIFGTNTFSTPIKGDEVWVLNFSDNEQQLYWFRKDSLEENDLLTDKEGKIDVLLHRDSFKGWGTLYFSDGSGWILSRDGSKINIDPQGNIHLIHPNPNRTISVTPQSISLGKKNKSDHTATYADQLIPVLYKMASQFCTLKQALRSNPYTAGVAQAIDSYWGEDPTATVPSDAINAINKIESTNVTLQ